MSAGLAIDLSIGAEFGRIVQLAVHAPSILDLARRFTDEMRAGPFYVMEHIPLQCALYRGKPASFDHSSAYGQLGEVMIELIHQHGDEPSAVRDMYAAGEVGFHHAAIFVDDLDVAIRRAQEAAMTIALDALTMDGVRFVMADARHSFGCMLEFYEPSPVLQKFYGFIRRKAEGWDGKEPLRRL